MVQPAVPIDIDPETGIWRTDGLPMLYLPRHFLVNNHKAVEQALGRDAYSAILREATEKSAIHWCRSEAKAHGLDPEATFRHYFKRLSQRGWGQFSIESLEPNEGQGRIDLKNSVFVLEAVGRSEYPLCYMFEGFITGAFRFLLRESRGAIAVRTDASILCREVCCAGLTGAVACSFEFSTTDRGNKPQSKGSQI